LFQDIPIGQAIEPPASAGIHIAVGPNHHTKIEPEASFRFSLPRIRYLHRVKPPCIKLPTDPIYPNAMQIIFDSLFLRHQMLEHDDLGFDDFQG